MNSESKLVVELWDYFRDMIGASKRQDAALHLLRLFQEYGIEVEQSEIEGECEYLDEAIEALLEDEDEDDGYYDEDED
jgi:hypothetical protein